MSLAYADIVIKVEIDEDEDKKIHTTADPCKRGDLITPLDQLSAEVGFNQALCVTVRGEKSPLDEGRPVVAVTVAEDAILLPARTEDINHEELGTCSSFLASDKPLTIKDQDSLINQESLQKEPTESQPVLKKYCLCKICNKLFSVCNEGTKQEIPLKSFADVQRDVIFLEKRIFICTICKSAESRRVARKNNPKKVYICAYCDKVFNHPWHLKGHERVHTGEKPFKCQYCEKAFSIPSNVKRHERTHTGEKPYRCKWCDKVFNNSSNLRAHERIHTGEKPYPCNYCEKEFNSPSNLKLHVRIHTGEKPYQCKYCFKDFTGSSYLKTHERIHTGEKPHQCKYCNKLFNDSSYLRTHERLHSGEKSYKCKYDKV